MDYAAREFSKESYIKYDEFAKTKISSYLVGLGYTILNSDEDYNHDIVATKKGTKYYFELEVKVGYPFTDMNDYRFDTVSFLGRKSRLREIAEFFYIIICYETGSFVFCPSNIIFNENYKEQLTVNGNNRRGRDEMYRVPKEKCTFIKL